MEVGCGVGRVFRGKRLWFRRFFREGGREERGLVVSVFRYFVLFCFVVFGFVGFLVGNFEFVFMG